MTVAADGEAALQLAREILPDLILSDVMMPGLDGFGLLNEVRRDPLLKSTPVILISARAGEDAWIEGLESGADDYMVKPFSARELQARVAAHIAMARLRRQAEEWERVLRADAESEQGRLRELLMHAPAAICILDGPEHRFTYVNLEFVKTARRARHHVERCRRVRKAAARHGTRGFPPGAGMPDQYSPPLWQQERVDPCNPGTGSSRHRSDRPRQGHSR
ncbi:MAG TPA: response regulator [Candidatus Dormibacteraeota bacterium]|nr:response regulator [Candidatus Dormibacteraeota bacterium]